MLLCLQLLLPPLCLPPLPSPPTIYWSSYKLSYIGQELMLGRVKVNNTTRSFLIDVIIRNQDIKKLETTCFGLTLAIIRFHLEKLFCKSVIQLCKRALVLGRNMLFLIS